MHHRSNELVLARAKCDLNTRGADRCFRPEEGPGSSSPEADHGSNADQFGSGSVARHHRSVTAENRRQVGRDSAVSASVTASIQYSTLWLCLSVPSYLRPFCMHARQFCMHVDV